MNIISRFNQAVEPNQKFTYRQPVKLIIARWVHIISITLLIYSLFLLATSNVTTSNVDSFQHDYSLQTLFYVFSFSYLALSCVSLVVLSLRNKLSYYALKVINSLFLIAFVISLCVLLYLYFFSLNIRYENSFFGIGSKDMWQNISNFSDLLNSGLLLILPFGLLIFLNIRAQQIQKQYMNKSSSEIYVGRIIPGVLFWMYCFAIFGAIACLMTVHVASGIFGPIYNLSRLENVLKAYFAPGVVVVLYSVLQIILLRIREKKYINYTIIAVSLVALILIIWNLFVASDGVTNKQSFLIYIYQLTGLYFPVHIYILLPAFAIIYEIYEIIKKPQVPKISEIAIQTDSQSSQNIQMTPNAGYDVSSKASVTTQSVEQNTFGNTNKQSTPPTSNNL